MEDEPEGTRICSYWHKILCMCVGVGVGVGVGVCVCIQQAAPLTSFTELLTRLPANRRMYLKESVCCIHTVVCVIQTVVFVITQ